MSVGALIQRQIAALDLTLEEVAEQMMAITGRDTLTRHDVWRWRTDEVTPRFWLPALAQVLQIDVDELRAAARRRTQAPEGQGDTSAPSVDSPRSDETDTVTTYAARELILREQWNEIIRSARHALWLYGMAEYRYAMDDEVPVILKDAAVAGCEIRVLLLDPASSGIVDIDRDEGNPEGSLANRITAALARFDAMRQDCGTSMELRVYAAPPSTSIVRADDHLIVTPYVRYMAGRSSPTLELRRNSDGGMFDRYTGHFDSAWNRARDWNQ
ncbi:DUF5919 domain-containing protein [Catenulispora subtropica]|uniref:DUF5919 domain-containing protein n=1 Tax=Catenulispora subtropica TaxID=450798 RepID=A0ABN2SRY3_9ACTN